MRSIVGRVIAVGVLVVAAACTESDGGGGDDDPGPLRIDGPAQVDPDFDPFATVPVTIDG